VLLQSLSRFVVSGMVPHKVSTDPQGVCEEAEFGLEGRSVFPDSEECFLNNIMREVGFAGEKQYASEDDRLIPVKQHPEGLHIRVPYLLQQLRICDLVFHNSFQPANLRNNACKITPPCQTCNMTIFIWLVGFYSRLLKKDC